MHQVSGTVFGRWYVTVLVLTTVVHAVRYLGWKRTGIYAVVSLGVGIAFENMSVAFGFPYTKYAFDEALRDKELFVGDVPLMVSLSYASMGYLAFAAGRMVASGPWRTRGRKLWHEALFGVLLSLWVVWILDPAARLGEQWFLGHLFDYAGPGFWFGLPLGSQLGFLLTAVILVGTLTWLARGDDDEPVSTWYRHPNLTPLVAYHGQLVLTASAAFTVGATEIGGAAVLIWVPAAVITAVLWSVLRPAQ